MCGYENSRFFFVYNYGIEQKYVFLHILLAMFAFKFLTSITTVILRSRNSTLGTPFSTMQFIERWFVLRRIK